LSGKPINYSLPTDEPLFGLKAPSIKDIMDGKTQQLPQKTKLTSQKRKITGLESSSSASPAPKIKGSAKGKKPKTTSSTADPPPRQPSRARSIGKIRPSIPYCTFLQ
jgi:hypothetical protein